MESPDVRRRIMQAVGSEDTRPEMIVRHWLHAHGYRYRLHRRDLPGCPDIVFPRRSKIIFVHGCFWHGHSCRRGRRVPKTNTDYWTAKIARNHARDVTATERLQAANWNVLVIWDCELRDFDALAKRIHSFLAAGARASASTRAGYSVKQPLRR